MRARRRAAALLTAVALAVGTSGCTPAQPYFTRTVTSGIQVSAGFAPVVGDVDGDGWDDIWWFHPTGQDRIWWGRASGTFVHGVAPVQLQGGHLGVTGDFGGDAAEDVLFYAWDGGPSTLVVTKVGGGVASTRTIDLPGSHDPAVVVDGASRDSVVLQSSEAGTSVTWDPERGSDAVVELGTGDGTPVPGDFDGDGRGDVFLYRVGSLPDVVAWGDGAGGYRLQTARNVTGSYQVVALRADGDGRDDLAFVGDSLGYQPKVDVWFGNADRTFRTESRDAIEGRGLLTVHRSHVDGRDTIVKSGQGTARSWTIDAAGTTRTGEAGSYPGPFHLTAMVGRFHDGVADDLLRYDDGNQYPESLLVTPDR